MVLAGRLGSGQAVCIREVWRSTAVGLRDDPGWSEERSTSRRFLVQVIRNAEAIRPYGPPSYLVWSTGQVCTGLECAELTTALRTGAAWIAEFGRWGLYNAIVQWPNASKRQSYLVELEAASIPESDP
jgi:hypothetical protein